VYSTGNVYIADTSNCRIRKVTVSTGVISTIAGTGTNSYSGDNGAATSATIQYVYSVAVDSSGRQFHFIRSMLSLTPFHTGNVYIADWGSARVRKVTVSTGIISTIAGTGSGSYSGDNGAATSAGINPVGVALDASGIHSTIVTSTYDTVTR
jgi:uncharacterized alkaline shock family protein YloU